MQAQDLLDAAWNYELVGRPDRAAVCLDIAAKVDAYGDFVSAKQAEYAQNLILWSNEAYGRKFAPKPAAAVIEPAAGPAAAAIWASFGKLRRTIIGAVVFSQTKDNALWITYNDILVGRISEGGELKLFDRRIREGGLDRAAIAAEIAQIEQGPKDAVIAHGKATGVCGICGRTLTDPESIAAGIGPICAERI